MEYSGKVHDLSRGDLILRFGDDAECLNANEILERQCLIVEVSFPHESGWVIGTACGTVFNFSSGTIHAKYRRVLATLNEE